MLLTRRLLWQLGVFGVVAITAGAIMVLGYMRLPSLWFGIGRYTVTVELPASGGLYASGNVTYRGAEVGRVEQVTLTGNGVQAVLKLESGIDIPSDLDAEEHSQSAVGEQYVALIPRSAASPPLKDGDVIPLSRTSIPPDINALLDATNNGLQAIPRDNLKTVIDESYTAVGGLGPELARLVKGSTSLAIDARKNLDSLTALIDGAKPVLDSQTETAGSIKAWAANLADVTSSLQTNDESLQGLLSNGAAAADEARALVDRLQPTLPIVLANLVTLGQVAVTYRDGIEQLLVLLPRGAEALGAAGLANRDTVQDYKGAYLSFNLNLNVPPPCTTGYIPASQRRVPSEVDYPDRPAGDVYCRVPQDSPLNVRGARNTPCVTVPGKRAPTVKMCESDEEYVPLNDGFNWKGDPNATYSGQAVPQLRPGAPEEPVATAPPEPTEPAPIAIATYDPATGTYVGPDGQVYTQANLAQTSAKERTWQAMLLPQNPN